MSVGETDQWRSSWRQAGQRRLAQALGELTFEGLLSPSGLKGLVHPRPLGGDVHVLELSGGVIYRFRAQPSAWGGLHVEIGSVERHVGERPAEPVDSPIQLLLDAREALGASPELLCEWFEEINNSLLAEAQQCARLKDLDARQLATLDGVALEQHLDGHPKLIAHRGRVGWGLADLQAHAPEFGARVRLHWLVVAPELARWSGGVTPGRSRLLDESCDASARALLLERLLERAPELAETGVLVPVHPWQWQHRLAAQYGHQLARGSIVSLGELGDLHAPRLSIRTLANLDRPTRADLKLALTILNTSCWRGLPAEHVEHGGSIGAALRDRAEHDPLLRAARVEVLVDLGGVHVANPEFEALGRAPYRVREQLAAIWRESARGRLRDDEAEAPAAALQQSDLAGEPLIRAWVERSGGSLSDWLRSLFHHTARPLYHLLCAHGIGVIAHGQNLGLILREGLPVGMILRDVHGDVRRVDDERFDHGLPGSGLQHLRALPAEQLVHDLYTGYFVSVLRFVAPLLERSFGLPERELLRLLVAELRGYQRERPHLREHLASFDLFRPTMVRIALNRARLRAGHGGGEQRPLPELGPPLRNPLHEASGAAPERGLETNDER